MLVRGNGGNGPDQDELAAMLLALLGVDGGRNNDRGKGIGALLNMQGTSRGENRARGINRYRRGDKVDTAGEITDSIIGNNGLGGGYSSNKLDTTLAGILGNGRRNASFNRPQEIERSVTMGPDPRVAGAAQRDSLNDLFSQLMANITPGTLPDYESAMQDARQAINSAYRPQIKAIRGSSAGARKDTAGFQRDVEDMYQALSGSYQKMGKREVGQGKNLADAIQDVAQRGIKQTRGSAEKIINDQAALAEGLGMEQAGNASNQGVRQVTRKAGRDLAREGTQAATRQLEFSGNQRRYLNRGGISAELEGTNRSADLGEDLQDFLQNNRAAIAQVKGQRGSALAQSSSDIMASIAEAQAAQSEEMWDRMMDVADLKMELEDTRSDNKLDWLQERNDSRQFSQELRLEDLLDQRQALRDQQSGENSPYPDFVQDYTQILGQAPHSKQVAGIFNDLLRTQPFDEGRIQSLDEQQMIKLSPTAAARMAEDAARKAGITNPSDLAKIRLAAMTYAEGAF